MVGIRLMIIMAVVGGLIAYIADKMGSKIGKKKMTVFGLRPKYTSVLLTVISGMLISLLSIAVVSVSSDSARTALFGMEKIQKELKSLNLEKDQATLALDEAKGNVAKQNEKISALDKEIKASTAAKEEMEATKNRMESELAGVNEKYSAAQNEVASLSEAKLKLTNDISELEKTTERLHQGIANLREGQVYYRAGEVVYAAVLKGGMNEVKSKEQLDLLLNNANFAALQRLGEAMPDKPIQVIWMSKDFVDEALNVLTHNKKDYLFRVRTIANIMVGELVVCELEIVENKLIYEDDAVVYSANYDLRKMNLSANQIIGEFLTNVNHTAVASGVLPDPVTGKVGNVDAETMIQITNQLRNVTGRFTLTAHAKGNVYTVGPVRISIRLKEAKAAE